MRPLHFFCLATAALALMGCGDKGAASSQAEADKELAAIEAIKVEPPSPDMSQEQYQRQYKEAWERKGPLVLAYFEKHPNDEKVVPVMSEYWQSLMRDNMPDDEVLKLVDGIEASARKSTNPELRQHAAFWATFYRTFVVRKDAVKIMQLADNFVGTYANDPRGAVFYSFAAVSEGATLDQKKRAYASLANKFPTTTDGDYAVGVLPMIEHVGKPFDFSFTDVSTGKTVSSATLKGKVVVVDFWATWCLPCIQSLPSLKQTYAAYKEKGVEFIGVSLDNPADGGTKSAVLEFLKKYEVPWPQFYQAGDNSFSSKFGVTRLPSLFIVGRDGTLVSADGARVLDRTLKELTS